MEIPALVGRFAAVSMSRLDDGRSSTFDGSRVLLAEDNSVNVKVAAKIAYGLGVPTSKLFERVKHRPEPKDTGAGAR